MSSERWQERIREKPEESSEEGFYMSKPEDLPGASEVKIRYLLVTKEGVRDLPEGVYVQTNLTPESFDEFHEVRQLIVAHVCLELRDPKVSPSGNNGPELDSLNAISLIPAFLASNGGLVLKLEPVLPSKFIDMLHTPGVGRTFIPRDQKDK